ncbi:preprotein translocase subunit YajC [Propionibacterium cyclohexanicum]|uniref:Preprotein translocase subunit YajC n=1 Tax=Propionibacterium cyclohexanicum TaxID=64702 RepID=A0A1H9Q386_9ACTN|nr:preprotein translocase subunit YajC [Propionibacterium cyclohexanicum]SER54884.1 preprotein translocase subunit YajC [Propionibacterium cyclohexanicum]
MQGSSLIILVVVMFAAMYFLMIRPQKKQMDKQREMLNKAQPGSRVMLTSGIFGTIRAAGEKQFVVELAPGVDITVVKQAVTRVVPAEEEEFEFADSDATDDTTPEAIEADATAGTEESLSAPSEEISIGTTPASPSLSPIGDAPREASRPTTDSGSSIGEPPDTTDSQPLAAAPEPDADDAPGRDRN